ncbi:hypothetical protein GWI33_006682 [Rhynchophorus ferrugineus]|uniref:Uncharacterized protein n=1 Tax=Rhynchophorus ferrugineus TaxID=354439 RepID=A0A834MIT0_RHYFE|nr:hypothetical protein GWI33_006682 [Rhynchophorus ferrugineus]
MNLADGNSKKPAVQKHLPGDILKAKIYHQKPILSHSILLQVTPARRPSLMESELASKSRPLSTITCSVSGLTFADEEDDVVNQNLHLETLASARQFFFFLL